MIFNRLRVIKKPNVEKFLQLVYLFFLDIDDYFLNGCQSKTAFVYPIFPSKKSSLYKILRNKNISIVNNPHQTNVIKIYFHDTTKESDLHQYQFDINQSALDISKTHIDKIHLKIFGYNTTIDPLTFKGKGLVKSDTNALHDGRQIEFPIQKIDETKIYQIIIDNCVGDFFLDYRICVINNEIPVIYLKYKELKNRFTNDIKSAKIAPSNCIPNDIKAKIIHFAQEVGCNFCELDVLKDNQTQHWYVIDVNKTPYGPPAKLGRDEKKKAIQILSDSFYHHFIKK